MKNKVEIQSELERAEKALSAAKILFDSTLYEDSISRCYYSILHAAKAVLLIHGIRVESHDAVKRLFGREMIKSGLIENEYAIILREEQDERLLADYDVTYAPDKELIEERIADAERFIRRMEQYVASNKM